MVVQIQLRRDLAANWTAENPVLAEGEIGFELDTGEIKVGDGSTAWNTLPYYSSLIAPSATITVEEDNAASVSGVATLDFGHGLDKTGAGPEIDIAVDETELDHGLFAGLGDNDHVIYMLKAAADVTGTIALTGVISPTQIAANTDNYAPTNIGTSSVLRLSTDASRNLTGITTGASGRILLIHNIGSNPLVLKHDVTSTAANRQRDDAVS